MPVANVFCKWDLVASIAILQMRGFMSRGLLRVSNGLCSQASCNSDSSSSFSMTFNTCSSVQKLAPSTLSTLLYAIVAQCWATLLQWPVTLVLHVPSWLGMWHSQHPWHLILDHLWRLGRYQLSQPPPRNPW